MNRHEVELPAALARKYPSAPYDRNKLLLNINSTEGSILLSTGGAIYVSAMVVHFVANFVADNGQGDRIDKACDKAPDKDRSHTSHTAHCGLISHAINGETPESETLRQETPSIDFGAMDGCWRAK